VAVVTDSTAGLTADVIAAHQLTVVPLSVTIDGVTGREGIDVAPSDVAKALVARRVSVTTSRPPPGEFAEVYERLLAAGAGAVVSVHLSGKLSGTCEAARSAAAGFPRSVAVVDSQSSGLGLGFCVLAATGAGELSAAVAAARAAVARTTTLFYVDTLEYLRRGGRIGAASALLGTALSVKPILRMVDGEIVVRDKVRTASRALNRLEDLAVEAAGDGPVDLGIQHLAAPERAQALVARLRERLGERLGSCFETEVGAAVGAHVGPGLVSAVVHNRPAD
jgi:DegV family protein with EDD domain